MRAADWPSHHHGVMVMVMMLLFLSRIATTETTLNASLIVEILKFQMGACTQREAAESPGQPRHLSQQ